MRPANAPDRISRRPLLAFALTLASAVLVASSFSALAQQKEKQRSDTPIEKPLVNTPILVIDAVTAPLAAGPNGEPGGTVIMTLSVDCGSVENARAVDALMPRIYNAVILELNREPLGKSGRLNDQDLNGVKQRLLYQINRALQGPQISGVYIRSLQEVPRRGS